MPKRYYEELVYIAKRLRVHPRTVLRAFDRDQNTYWTATVNPDLELTEVAKAFGIEFTALYEVLYGDDDMLLPGEAAALLGIHERTLRKRREQHPPVLRYGRIVRYSKLSLSSSS